jgi:hypothetical protein
MLGSEADYDFHPLPVFVSPVVRREVVRGVWSVHVDVSLQSDQPLHALLMQNHYTASIGVSLLQSAGEAIVLLQSKQLMESAHCENDATAWVTLRAAELNTSLAEGNTIRIHLFQPFNSIWNDYEIRNISAVYKVKKNNLLTDSNKLTGGNVSSLSVLLKNDIRVITSSKFA